MVELEKMSCDYRKPVGCILWDKDLYQILCLAISF